MKKFLTTKEAAELFGFKPDTIRHWVRKGYLKVYRRSPKAEIRIDVKDLEKLMQSGSKIAR